MTETVKDVLDLIKGQDIKMVDFRFIDPFGIWQHFSVSAKEVSEETFEEGVGFDGSSIRGFQTINESDMILIPDTTTTFVDPIFEVPTAVIICDIYDPLTRQPYTKDPRYIAKKAEAYLKQTGIADASYFGPEAEFFLFDHVRYGGSANSSFYFVDSGEAWWNTGLEGMNLGGQIPAKRGYFPVPPTDTLQDVRSKMVLAMEEIGIEVEVHHHEVGTAGQCEIDLRFDTLTRMADKLITYKYIVKNIARMHGLSATFMPKPLFEDNGSGMHTHQSLWKNGNTIMYDENGYAGLSEAARFYIGGLLKHAPTLLAFAAPSTNSYKRLVPGYEAPINLVYSQRNRSAICRIPMYTGSPKAKRIEFRAPDPSCNPYLAFASMLMAGLDGIQNQIDPGEPTNKDMYDLPPEEAAQITNTPTSLDAVLDALETDNEFLLKGDVFTEDLIEAYIEYKRTEEIEPISLRPHPHEFNLYFDI
ncbi:MAG: type I glutamate--ammonia ligase [Anaerolineae bacterium]|nr:type I glutamate--ammonia ligase [Anaerolineae bacterium]